ncbi:hypothetical protein Ddye_017959 [Dipteronia dyeriana]|uniref:Uncharacterized protein n=1 Tax=Dipteronia dyeriana TaxID=168575 RepID=A0AAD9UAM9_9ROSI|nr:hypothetical protein Ddye_017959 [Dipteronia dyeriana]
MFRMFMQFYNFIEVKYLPVVFPSNNQKENALHFAEKTSHALASAFNVVETSHSYGEVMLQMRASQLKQIFIYFSFINAYIFAIIFIFIFAYRYFIIVFCLNQGVMCLNSDMWT